MRRMRARFSAVSAVAPAFLALLLLGACTGLSQRAVHGEPGAPARFLLAPAVPAEPERPGAGPALEVARVRAAAGYGTDAMLYLRRPRRLEAYARGRWMEAPARMLQPALVDALAGSGLFPVVVPGPASVRVPLRLETTLLALHHDLTGAVPQVRIVLRVMLVDRHARRVLAARRIAAAAPAPANGAGAMADGAARALERALAAVVAFCREVLAQPKAVADAAGDTAASASSTTSGSEGRRRASSESMRRQRAAPGRP